MNGAEGAALIKIVLEQEVTENYSSVLVGEERKRDVVLKLCKH